MAQLDYALLAEHARLEPGGTVSLLGASFSQLVVPAVPAQVPLAVVGRVLFSVGEGSQALLLTILGPDDLFRVTLDTEVDTPSDPVPGVGPAVSFVISLMLPLPAEGVYSIQLALEGAVSKTMEFRVVATGPSVQGG